MHSRRHARTSERIWQISLEQIEATVSDFLGPGRVKDNNRRPTFSRHVSMYLARHVGGWSYPKISRFYNGRHYTTFIAAIGKIERLRKEDESIDALIEMLTSAPSPETALRQSEASRSKLRQLIVDAIAERICAARVCGAGEEPPRISPRDRLQIAHLVNTEVVEMMRVAHVSQSAFSDPGMPLSCARPGVIVAEKPGRSAAGKSCASPSDGSSSAIGEEAPPIEQFRSPALDWLSQVWTEWRSALVIVKPDTVIAWHRRVFRIFWTWNIRRGKPGYPAVSEDIRALIRRMSRENPNWGAPRIHGELLKLGIDIGETSKASGRRSSGGRERAFSRPKVGR